MDTTSSVFPEPAAHVRQTEAGLWDEPQSLLEHLEHVAKIASEFARPFKSAAWAYEAGIGHDLGKSTKEWQNYLIEVSGYGTEDGYETTGSRKIEHSAPGAKAVEEAIGKGPGRILSYLIAGHHTGLPDWSGTQSSLQFRMQQTETDHIPRQFRQLLGSDADALRTVPWRFSPDGLDMSLWIRMLFSCLVDADYLDTERYMKPETANKRHEYASLELLRQRYDAYMKDLTETVMRNADTPVNRIRRTVLADCRAAASMPPGFFSLTVPTGGGKTLSSLAFALDHALVHRKQRIIYVMPYTSIIEQNADVFRRVLGDDQVVEHHCNIEERDVSDDDPARLATENWDAPLIVTTTVQFFESLFAAKPGRCRKLHNIVDSVVILDEAQLMPVEYLKPILETLRILTEHFGTSIVICTATQPVLEKQQRFPQFAGLPQGSVREIVQDVSALYRGLRRVEIAPIDVDTVKSWEEIARELSGYDRILCIVSDRKSCRDLHTLMPKGTYHLSALMCPQHRSEMISRIKADLKGDGPVRVISTQLVEAGVDIDFPIVYRSLAGLDSIAQAAGRCNREGLLSAQGRTGRVVVFVGPRKPPVGILRKACETTAGMIRGGLSDPLSPENFTAFFSELYWKANSLDANHICELLRPGRPNLGIQFRSASEAFHVVDDSMMKTLFVPYADGAALIETLKRNGPERWLLRKLQRYTVQVYENQFFTLLHRGSLLEVAPNFFALQCKMEYSEEKGLLIDDICSDPEAYITS